MSSALQTAIEEVKGWMLENEAELLVENLAPGATADELDALEEEFGFSLPGELKELWSLHHGQLDEMNGFVEAMDLFSGDDSLREREQVEARLERLPADSEFASTKWVPFAGRDSDMLLVNADSGRVCVLEKDWPPIRHVASSLTEWAQQYAQRVLNGDFEVKEGFGDYFLSQRDRG